MSIEWGTKEKDLSTARSLLSQYTADIEERFLGLQEVTVVREGSIQIERADWVLELEDIYQQEYGAEKGSRIAQNVLTALVTQGQTVH